MSQVFISYRQINDEQKQRVRAFAERLCERGIDVVLDQLFLDDYPGGPDEGWPKWSSDHASKTEFVLIVGNESWFQCFDGTQQPGTGLGAACEAGDIRTRIYNAANVISNIRVVLLKEGDDKGIPDKLSPYHRFHAERDLANIVRWINSNVESGDTPRTSIPHNLPTLQPFFGREEELRKIADALDPENPTWGLLIDGQGGIGKTSLAVRAAYDASGEDFDKIVFISLKSRELDDDSVRDLSGFLISGLAELLNELARELGHDEITKATEDKRPRMLLDALRGTRTLLVLDNLESLLKRERDIILNFVKRLPLACKAILTSRQRIGSAAEELFLGKLSEQAALATLAKLAESSFVLAKTSEAERLDLYHETDGKPLLLRWTAGQIGRGSCLTLADAIAYLSSCPEGNDPLEFIFGDLVDEFSESESRVLCALTYFTLPAKAEHLAELAESSQRAAERTLYSLINRSLVMPSEELKTFTLVPLVADFLHKKRPEVVANMGDRLEKHAYKLVVENGYEQYDRFHVLEAAWPTVSAALPRILAGANEQLQTVTRALFQPCNYSGRYDESLALSKEAENRAVSVMDFARAGWRAYQVGWIHYLRQQSTEVLSSADRAEAHWHKSQITDHHKAVVIHLRGIAHELAKNYTDAIAAFREGVQLWRILEPESRSLATGLSNLADAELQSGDFESAERNYSEALRILRTVNHTEGLATCIGNLAGLALDQKDWVKAEALAREALTCSEQIGRQQLIASHCRRLALALAEQGKKAEGLPFAQRAVEIFTRLRSSDIDRARIILTMCEN